MDMLGNEDEAILAMHLETGTRQIRRNLCRRLGMGWTDFKKNEKAVLAKAGTQAMGQRNRYLNKRFLAPRDVGRLLFWRGRHFRISKTQSRLRRR